MPNNPRRDKQKSRPKSKPRHVADLVQRVLHGRTTGYDTPALPASQDPAREWQEFLRATLEPELRAHVGTVLVKLKELVVFTESAAWCSRLKLVLGDLESAARQRDPAIARVQIRIMPAGAARPDRG